MLAAFLALALAAVPARADAVFTRKVVEAAEGQTKERVVYDGRYIKLAYPGGDVPAGLGVCTDVVIRAFRKAGVDLQVAVHQDMSANFSAYPKKWGRRSPDRNIDHRRVPNLMTFFRREGASLPLSMRAEDYAAGDLVTWDLGGGLTHIGIVVAGDGGRPLIVHNIGRGPQREDVLFSWTITGHYRWKPRPVSPSRRAPA
ncbi:MAG: DUF1287 domain-containing protein [Elusimicrobiota bacterium]|nr:DUF1287 domain-containing protein [Elusimicrobiota bacterium]